MDGSHSTAAPLPPGLEAEDYYFEGPLQRFRNYCVPKQQHPSGFFLSGVAKPGGDRSSSRGWK